ERVHESEEADTSPKVNDGKQEVEEMEELFGEEEGVHVTQTNKGEDKDKDTIDKKVDGEEKDSDEEKEATVKSAQWDSVQIELSWLRMMMEEFSKKSDKRVSLVEDNNKRLLEEVKQLKAEIRNMQRSQMRNG